MATGYTYTPLNASKQQIRVLCFDPSKPPRPDGLLECSLEHISLRGLQRPIYYAISYVWGNASAREELIIGGTRVNVPASSAAASLEIHRRLTYHQAERQRRSYPIVRLWLDAVCINQSDEHERSQQVAMMHQVYSKAYEVLIWLG
ncbi:heterokaryon incompatibility protein-domain-containing protein, partial [Lophiotrema nucula]